MNLGINILIFTYFPSQWIHTTENEKKNKQTNHKSFVSFVGIVIVTAFQSYVRSILSVKSKLKIAHVKLQISAENLSAIVCAIGFSMIPSTLFVYHKHTLLQSILWYRTLFLSLFRSLFIYITCTSTYIRIIVQPKQ